MNSGVYFVAAYGHSVRLHATAYGLKHMWLISPAKYFTLPAVARRVLHRAGNLFEGEWREGKPVVNHGEKMSAGPMDWLNEAVASVASNIGGGNRRGEYASVSTHDEDDDENLRRR